MGLVIEGSELKSTAASDKMTNSSGKLSTFDETNILNNGNSAIESLEVVNPPPLVISETSSPSSSSAATGKGSGLKKWKRIKRDASVRQTSEGSVSSSNALLRSFGDALEDGFGGIGDSGLVIGPMLVAGTDSENSEGREMNRMKNLSGKNLVNSVNNGHQEKPMTESSKKARGESVKSEKENSISRIESVFVQGSNSATTNGNQSGMPLFNGGETGDEAECSRKFAEFEVTSDDIIAADTLWFAKDDKNIRNGVSRDLDPFAESIMLLQSVQKELGKEVEKFKDIGNGDLLPVDLSEQLESGEVIEESFNILKPDAICLNGMVNSLKDMEFELERLYKQKIEVEIEYIAITTTVQNMRIAVANQIKIFGEKNREQVQMHMKLGDAECKAVMLKKQSEKMVFFCDDESLKLRSNVWKYTSVLLLQLVLFAVFIFHLSPYHADFVPT